MRIKILLFLILLGAALFSGIQGQAVPIHSDQVVVTAGDLYEVSFDVTSNTSIALSGTTNSTLELHVFEYENGTAWLNQEKYTVLYSNTLNGSFAFLINITVVVTPANGSDTLETVVPVHFYFMNPNPHAVALDLAMETMDPGPGFVSGFQWWVAVVPVGLVIIRRIKSDASGRTSV